MTHALHAGTLNQPITRQGNHCSYRGCPKHVSITRITTTGAVVGYCSEHEKQAARLFDNEWRLDQPSAPTS